MLPNIPEYPIVTLGILNAGAIVTTLNPVYTACEYVFIFENFLLIFKEQKKYF